MEASAALSGLIEASRRLGADPTFVLHGGGNTSLKTQVTDLTGASIETLFVKASGQDLGSIDETGFAPLRMARLRDLLPPVGVPDDALINELRCALLDAAAPDPSVETLLHALLPHPAVVHSHADALLTVCNTPDGAARLNELFEDRVLLVEYAMPGPDLVASCHDTWAKHGGPDVHGLMVLGHGLFTVGATPAEAYRRHLHWCPRPPGLWRRRLRAFGATPLSGPCRLCTQSPCADLRQRISAAAGRPLILTACRDAEVARFVGEPTPSRGCARGPLTPDHVIVDQAPSARGHRPPGIRTRRTAPTSTGTRAPPPRTLMMLDPAPARRPRPRPRNAYRGSKRPRGADRRGHLPPHDVRPSSAPSAWADTARLSAGHVFDLEYWALQQAKLARRDTHRPLAGQVAVVTGAASGIGRACAQACSTRAQRWWAGTLPAASARAFDPQSGWVCRWT